MPKARTPFNIRLRSDLLADLRIVALYTPATMTSAIEDALDAHLPPLLDKIGCNTQKLDRRIQAARET
jgi:hypothetical protein